MTFNLQARQTSEGVIFQLATETNCGEPDGRGGERERGACRSDRVGTLKFNGAERLLVRVCVCV